MPESFFSFSGVLAGIQSEVLFLRMLNREVSGEAEEPLQLRCRLPAASAALKKLRGRLFLSNKNLMLGPAFGFFRNPIYT